MPTALTSDPLIASLPLKSGKPKLGPVLLESKLGQGGLGAVYLGYHTGLDMPVAVKVLPKKRLAELPGTLARFVREVRASARCRHPSVVGVFGYDESEELHYVILEYVAGVILAQQINAAPLLEARALDILIPIAEGLAEIWRNGLLHRDIKPENIIVPTDGPAKLLDLGLVGRDRLDLKGQIVGTPQYMSPEAARDDVDIGIQADMWSFGATLYHAVTGKQPFEADDAMACRQRVLNDEPPPPSAVNANVSGPVSRLILKLLSKKPEDRFASSAEFLRALRVVREQITSGPGIEETQVRVGSGERPAGSSTRGAGAGDVIGNCRLLQQVGAGAFGVVFKAHHALLDVDLAVKLLPLDLAEKDRIYIDLFLREARTAARIHHPNVVSIFEAGNHDGQYYLVMEYVPGGTVADRMAAHGGRLPADEVEQVLLSVARGLAAAAELNIIHRDIKPANLMFAADGTVKIADLGLAKRLRSAGEAAATGEDASLTQHGGALRGTPAYMAPEMARDPESADTRADLYSLGASAYDMLAGRPPFRGKTTVDVILKHINEAPQPIQQAAEKVPPKLAGIVMRLLAKSPEERYQSGADLVKDLEAPESEMLRKHGAPTPIPPIAEREAWIKGMGAAVVRKGLVKGYQILAVKGVGSLGVVYKARQWSMDRIVALKVLPPEMTKNQRFVEEFLVQARNTGRLNHPNLIHIHEVGKSGDVYYYSMEYLEGQRLDEMLDRGEDEEVGSAMAMANSPCEGRLKPRQAVDIASQVLAALDYGSRAGVIHREVRPNCIFVLPDGHVKLADLGLVVDEQTRFLEGENAFYVAPEQISGKRVDTRADIYSVGCCLYQCLTGDPPFEGGAPGEILRRRLAFPAPDPKRVNPQVRPELAYVVMRMMACMPSERYQTPAEAADALRAMVEIV